MWESFDIDTDIVPVKLHLSCDEYLGELLETDKELTEAAQYKFRVRLDEFMVNSQ